jgi:hypothetical protein
MGINRAAARNRALSRNSWPVAGRCLEFVDWVMGNPSSRMGDTGLPGAPANGNWQDAQEGWWGSLYRVPGDATDAPLGVPIYYTQMRGGSPAGHIAWSLGDGTCRTTTGLRVITQSIDSLNRERIRPDGRGSSVLGYTLDYGNNPIDGISLAPKPTPTPEDDMFTNADSQRLEALAKAANTYELVRKEPHAEVWFSVNRLNRFHVADEAKLLDYQFYINERGQRSDVKIVDSLESFGAITADDPKRLA